MRSRELNDSTMSPEWKLGLEAADWVSRLQDPDGDPDEPYGDPFERQTAFLDWLHSSPEHVRAILQTLEVQHRLRSLDSGQNAGTPPPPENGVWEDALSCLKRNPTEEMADQTAGQAGPHDGSKRHRQFFRKKHRHVFAGFRSPLGRWRLGLGGLSAPVFSSATALVVAGAAVIAFTALAVMSRTRSPPPFTADYTTGVGEREYVLLPDGSRITLNTATRLTVEYGRDLRQVRLYSGEALFDVHHDAHRLFRVLGRNTRIENLGTRFDLYLKPTGMQVWAIEGSVHVLCACGAGATAASVTLEQHQMAEVVGTVGTAMLTTRDVSTEAVEHATAWRYGEMWFNGDKLGTAVAEFNR